jgi:HNH/Endo VII superfamily toxin with a SHH signature
MYNLDVANLDNFYVGEQGWLVHNGDPFEIVRYGSSASGFANHHAILDKWAAANIPGYISRKADAPTIRLATQVHIDAHKVQYDWLEEVTGRRTFQGIDWTKITSRQIEDLSNRIYEAAGVPTDVRQVYNRVWNQYIYEGKWLIPCQ